MKSLITIKPTALLPLISSTHLLNPKTHLKNPVISAKWGKKRSGSQRFRNNKLIFNAITVIASNLKIIPEPFDSVVKELWIVSGGGNGGKNRFGNGFGGGGRGGNGGRGKKSKLGFLIVFGISIGLGIWGVLERERMSDYRILCGIAFVVYSLLKRNFGDWILGFCCGACLIGLGFMNNSNLIKLVDEYKINFRNFGVSKKRRFKRWI